MVIRPPSWMQLWPCLVRSGAPTTHPAESIVTRMAVAKTEFLGARAKRLARLATAWPHAMPSYQAASRHWTCPVSAREVALEVCREQIDIGPEVRLAGRHPKLLERHAERRLRHAALESRAKATSRARVS